MGYEKVSRLDVFNIQTKDERVTFDSKHLTKASGSYEFYQNSSSTYEEVINMSEYISRQEFEQLEKRIEDNFKHLNSKIDSLPDRFSDKMEIALNQQLEKIRKERKDDKKSIITWSLTGTGIIVALLTFLFNFIF
ncbi:hypothetical protein [Staphylococcus delphini]|uniref:Uncharacterized protein n=2 Tax=Staphylococcus delphini TaxID=53344 RepID=A0AAQ0D7K2_9STAP|nr:hypothetical protein [Staphylococcus delphini]MDE9752964.1 hypothetical protein [Staphylococcus delphini]MDE9791144.1 hypothetical protein [Staphylococcus delphini]MDE9793457.1 hypothetical protein [Staphylococcus delphini]MDE9794741.1 hypothetical protein [Staphylococcus delphini]MDE9798134.1 hypothetical protein [Staphylococcus delphini]